MLMAQRNPQPTRDLDFCKTRQVGQDLGSDLENRNAGELRSLEMKWGAALERG